MSCYDNHFLFSETYIKEYLKDKSRNREFVEIVNEKYRLIKDWYNEYTTGDYSNYPWSEYIDAILDVMGFQKKIENSTRILYSDSIKEGIEPVAVCYLIDKTENVASAVKGKYYAYNAINEARKNNINWAFLTNGNKWRLYNTKNISPYENYLEIDIEDGIKYNKQADGAFSLFFLFFNARTYYFEDGEFVIEKIKDESDAKAEIIEETLRGKAEEILKELCYGLKEDIGKESFTEEERKAIYNDAIILLYRMLFFGYAESRGLLPITKDDPDYIESFSKLCEDAKEVHNTGSVLEFKEGFEFWTRLDSQLRIYVDRSYNGGLFHNEDKPILKEHRIANGRLTKCLAELSFNLNKNGQYVEKIEYKDLSVRNLGSIYEGLLEYQLFIAEERMVQRKSKGQVKYFKTSEVKLQNSDLKNIIEKGGIYLSQDALERKETGAYYTPEDVVDYIVDNTIGKRIVELKNELRNKTFDLYYQLKHEPTESGKRIIQMQIDENTLDFIICKILDLKIIDSAMGSGHFLVNAAYRVTNEIVDIICANNWSNEDIIVDTNYWKRKVVENCIYGIDINELSVALARLSLWLISASNDKALSFIDHHLKQGNSVIGTDRNHVVINDKRFPLFGVDYEEYMRPVIKLYEELSAVGSATKEDVIRQKEIYEQINKELELVKKKYDYYLASQYAGGIADKDILANLLRSKSIKEFEKIEYKSLWDLAKEKQFFHWELEFPEVFLRGGFDIAIGNPPYVDVKESDYRYSTLKFKGTRNLYAYMIDNNLHYVKKQNSKLSYIVLLSLVCSDRMKSLRKHIINSKSNSVKFINIDSSKNPGTLFKKVIARLVILVIDNSSVDQQSIETSNYIKFFSKDRKKLFKNIKTTIINNQIIKNDILPKIGSDIEKTILTKMFSKTKYNIFSYVTSERKDNYFYYRDLGATYYCYAFCEPPIFRVNGEDKIPATLKKIYLKDNVSKYIASSVFYSSLFYWFWTVYSDCYHLTKDDISRFPINIKDKCLEEDSFISIYKEIEDDLYRNGKMVTYNKVAGKTEYYEFRPRYSKDIFDKVDKLLAQYYGFTDEELEYIMNYDLRFRIDEEAREESE